MDEEKVKSWMWLHVDCGKSQYCAKFVLGSERFKYNHGDKIDSGIFRLIDRDYDKEFLREALPIAKKIWAINQMNYGKY